MVNLVKLSNITYLNMVNKTFKGNYLELRHNTYYVVLYVPKDVKNVIGKHKFYKSTETGNLKVAQTIASVFVMKWKAEIESARSKSDEPIINSALHLRKLFGNSPTHLVNDVIDEETQKLIEEDKPLQADVFKRIASGKNKYLKELINTWIIHERQRNLKDKTIQQMNADVGLLVKTFPTSNLLEETNILIWLQSLGKNGLTPSSINRIIGSCRNFYRYLQLIKEVPKSTNTPFLVPIEYKIGKNSNSKSLNKKEPWLPFEIEDIEFLYQESIKDKKENLTNLILIGSYTGARIGEICSIKCSHINFKNTSISIVDAKTESGKRIIPIHENILPKIKNLIDTSTDEYLISGLTFNQFKDRSNAVGKQFGRLKTKHGFDDLHVFHSIRKTVTTILENSGVSENIAADILGHEKPRITYGLYSGGTNLEVKREAINKISFNF